MNSPASPPAITVSGVTKTFSLPHEKRETLREWVASGFRGVQREQMLALHEVSFEVARGSCFGIVGRNGSGKSTLLKILAGIFPPNAGSVEVRGNVSPFLELGVGFNPDLSARDNVYLNAAVLGLRKREIDAVFDEIIAFAELERFVDQKLKNFSSGMHVRLAFSVAIKANADVYLMDEVLAVGDMAFQQKCFDVFRRFRSEGKTIVLVSHDLGSIRQFCERTLYLRNGEMMALGPTDEVLDKYVYEDRPAVPGGPAPIDDPAATRTPVRIIAAHVLDKAARPQRQMVSGHAMAIELEFAADPDGAGGRDVRSCAHQRPGRAALRRQQRRAPGARTETAAGQAALHVPQPRHRGRARVGVGRRPQARRHAPLPQHRPRRVRGAARRALLGVGPHAGRGRVSRCGGRRARRPGRAVKIAIDGYTLGLKEGTGLATFAYELAQTLSANGHEVSAVYGLNGLGRSRHDLWPRLLERLGVSGEAHPREWLRWAPYAAAYLAPVLLGWPLKARLVPRNAELAVAGSPARIPDLAHVYTLPSIYQSAQAIAALTRRQTLLQRLPGVEIFHCTMPLPLRMRGVANVVTVHDVIPLALPNSTIVNPDHYRRIMDASLQGADAVFTVSEHSKRDLLAHFDVPADRVTVTYQAVNLPPALREMDEETLAQRLKANFDLSPRGYFLFFGAVEPKKNVLRILDAHAMAKSDLPLVVAGRYGWMYDEEQRRIGELMADPKTRHRIRRFEYLPFAQLMALVRGARAVVFPSLYEGFGLPVLEAMAMGVPVITSNTTSLPEVAGDAALLVDPRDAGEIARAMERLAGDDRLCAELVRKGYERARLFTPERYLQRLEQGYRQALG